LLDKIFLQKNSPMQASAQMANRLSVAQLDILHHR